MAVTPLRSTSGHARWEREASRLLKYYPAFREVRRPPFSDTLSLKYRPSFAVERTEHLECESPVRTWIGKIQPFGSASMDETLKIIADLSSESPVSIPVAGQLRHLRHCTREVHDLPTELRPARLLTESFTVEVICRRPPATPIVRGIAPLIVRDAFGIQEPCVPPHLLQQLGALCVISPSDGTWNWERGDGLLEFLDHTAIWLAKHAVWMESRERLGSARGVWPGAFEPHDEFAAIGRLCQTAADALCRCGSAKAYAACCREQDLFEAREIMGMCCTHAGRVLGGRLYPAPFRFPLSSSLHADNIALARFRPESRRAVRAALDLRGVVACVEGFQMSGLRVTERDSTAPQP